MPDIDLDDLKAEFIDLLKEEAKDLWDGEEDTEFLEEVGADLASLRFKKLIASEAEKETLDTEIGIVRETIAQKFQQKKNKLNKKGLEILPRIFSVLIKAAGSLL